MNPELLFPLRLNNKCIASISNLDDFTGLHRGLTSHII